MKLKGKCNTMSKYHCIKILSGLLIYGVVSTASAHATFKLPETIPYGIHDIVYQLHEGDTGGVAQYGPGDKPLTRADIDCWVIEPLNNFLRYSIDGNIYDGRYDDYLTIRVRCKNGATINSLYTYSELEQSIFIDLPIPDNCQNGNVLKYGD